MTDRVFTLERGPIDPTPIDLTPPGLGDGAFTALVGQALSDLGGVPARLDAVARPIVDATGANPDADLSGHEADLIASQQADRQTLGALYATDEVAAGDAGDRAIDAISGDVADVRAAHGALSPRIDDGAREFPPPPDLPDNVDPRRRDPSLPPRRQA